MARLSGSTLRTVRFYEETGLLRSVQRTEGGHRLFGERELHRLRLVADLRAAGLSLDDIRDLLEAKLRHDSGTRAARHVVARLAGQISEMRHRASVLERLAVQLEETRSFLSRCCECPETDGFPDTCGNCSALREGEEIPALLEVLWHLDLEKP
jgi:DNA-binding transcriptional MerR regulator